MDFTLSTSGLDQTQQLLLLHLFFWVSFLSSDLPQCPVPYLQILYLFDPDVTISLPNGLPDSSSFHVHLLGSGPHHLLLGTFYTRSDQSPRAVPLLSAGTIFLSHMLHPANPAQLTDLLWLYSKYILNVIDMTLNLITTFSSNLASCTLQIYGPA